MRTFPAFSLQFPHIPPDMSGKFQFCYPRWPRWGVTMSLEGGGEGRVSSDLWLVSRSLGDSLKIPTWISYRVSKHLAFSVLNEMGHLHSRHNLWTKKSPSGEKQNYVIVQQGKTISNSISPKLLKPRYPLCFRDWCVYPGILQREPTCIKPIKIASPIPDPDSRIYTVCVVDKRFSP